MPNEHVRTASDTLILHVALPLFARGYDSTSIDDIRQATGLTSKANLYIQSKEEVVIPLLQQTMKMQNQKMLEAEQAVKAEPLHQLTASGHAFISRGLLHLQGYAFCFLRVQQDVFLQGRSTLDSKELHTPGHLLTGGLLPLRQTHPVRAIANAAFISLLVDALSSHKQLLATSRMSRKSGSYATYASASAFLNLSPSLLHFFCLAKCPNVRIKPERQSADISQHIEKRSRLVIYSS
ncbi:hypothetical protein EI42_06159 [Thermosporothrix hazakensis]|jgi:AcrR family transcriptional regulator|uniref:TetR family transcriptional regulator n=1 Tax=Thermosporothrix hazakensis TaxID=644383 RepID=A0A326TS38_THEHA|nr:helix-turn-helix transcriptional regulator [Thermosporothrix hazakensis]PZW19221.1 hypothetical protein EI42_06159 [Thermosporothrix hazakensis]